MTERTTPQFPEITNRAELAEYLYSLAKHIRGLMGGPLRPANLELAELTPLLWSLENKASELSVPAWANKWLAAGCARGGGPREAIDVTCFALIRRLVDEGLLRLLTQEELARYTAWYDRAWLEDGELPPPREPGSYATKIPFGCPYDERGPTVDQLLRGLEPDTPIASAAIVNLLERFGAGEYYLHASVREVTGEDPSAGDCGGAGRGSA